MRTASISATIVLALCLACPPLQAESIESLLDQAIAGNHRNAADRARDADRHPRETLLFFGIQADSAVVEIWPSSGWYTAILAPVLRPVGVFYAAGFALTAQRTPQWRKDMQTDLARLMAQQPAIYDHVVTTELDVPERTTIAPPGSIDLVLTFRNVHNWMKGDYAPDMFQVMARALKSGGTLGVVEHRARPGTSIEDMKKTGYVAEDYVIALAKAAGLQLEARSEINANPRDGRDHPAGVWTLPPGFRYCNTITDPAEKERCMAKYAAIGESDRMTLRFRKG